MAVIGRIKKQKLEANHAKRVERGAKKAQAKALRQARKLKEKNV
jgi:hypothetical protein